MATMTKANLKPQNDAARLHREAVQFLQAGKFNEGIARLKKAAKIRPDSANILKDLGTACWQAGRPGDADKYYRAALKYGPQNSFVLSTAGAFFHEQGDNKEAERLLLAAIRIKDDNFEAFNNLGLIYLLQERLDDAESCIARALQLNPLWPNAIYNKGRILAGREDFAGAEATFRHVLQIAPGHAPAMTALGNILRHTDKTDEALTLMYKAVSLFPAGREGWLTLIDCLDFLAKLEEAEDAIAQARKHLPETPEMIFMEAKIARRRGGAKDALAVMEKYLPGMKKTPRNYHYFYELGKLYEKLKMQDKAFTTFQDANNLWAQTDDVKKLNRTEVPQSIKRLTKAYTPAWIKSWTPTPSYEDTPEPVFLVGFPRSGTTLLGQILASHAKIDTADESPALQKAALFAAQTITGKTDTNTQGGITEAFKNIEAKIAPLSPDTIETMRTLFMDTLKEHGRDTSRPLLVDKMPLNLIHTGVIHRIFPKAKFILALRHPCDSVLSCFMQSFEPNSTMMQFTDIENSARFYDQVFSLWEHYRKVMPLNVHTIKYEDIVSDFRPAVEPLLDFLGVEWSDSVLEHDKSAKTRAQTKTPSYSQVTEKIYTTARGRWISYKDHMAPALPILAPWVEKHGYETL